MLDSIVAKEGKKTILVSFILFLVFLIIDCEILSLLSFVTMLLLIYIYRFSYIDINTLKKDEIYAPISGTVTSLDFTGFKKIITIEVSIFDSHILRSLEDSPFEIKEKKGANLNLGTYKASKLNESFTIKSKNATMVLISSIYNPPIEIYKKDNIKKGEKIGMFIHGEIKITLEENIKPQVSIGEKIKSGKTLLAKL